MLKAKVLRVALNHYRTHVLSDIVGDYAIKRLTTDIDIDDVLDVLYSYSNIDRILSAIDNADKKMENYGYKLSEESVTVAEYNELYDILSSILR